ncbi:hypothetical protein ACFQV8_00565 [Pseudonocardia benzenivorans]
MRDALSHHQRAAVAVDMCSISAVIPCAALLIPALGLGHAERLAEQRVLPLHRRPDLVIPGRHRAGEHEALDAIRRGLARSEASQPGASTVVAARQSSLTSITR